MKARGKHGEPEAARRDGGLCAAFVNSASRKRRGFATYSEVLAWALRCGAVDASHAERLERAAAEHPRAAAAVAVRVLEARALLARIFSARAERRAPAAADLEAFNAELSRALPARRLIPGSRQLEWSWGDRGGDDVDRVLWPVLWSAAEVLTSKYDLSAAIGKAALRVFHGIPGPGPHDTFQRVGGGALPSPADVEIPPATGRGRSAMAGSAPRRPRRRRVRTASRTGAE